MRWETQHVEELKGLWERGFRPTGIARELSSRWRRHVTRNMIIGKSRDLNLHYEGTPMTLAAGHPAVVEGRTLFRKQVMPPPSQVLKHGLSNRKLGAEVTKGRWKGMPIYSLTLEERATCPRSCTRWRDCYGNHMHNAKRHRHGPELEAAIERDLAELQEQHPGGFVVRLHVLGDFYSVKYVLKWADWLTQYPALRVFGYTAWPVETPIGQMIERVRALVWDRFAIRTSGADKGPRTIAVGREASRRQGRLALNGDAEAILCPVQTGQAQSCGTCTLCWAAPHKPIAFVLH